MMDRELFAELWLAGASVPEMAARLGCRQPAIYSLRVQFGLPRRPRVPCTDKDPTPDEIAERSAEVRARWSEEERERRGIGKVEAWGVPLIRLRG
jgi:hypothetical protein